MSGHMEKQILADVTAENKSLIEIRLFFTGALEGHGFDNDVTHLMELSLNEVCQNIIRHGYSDKTGKITVNIDFIENGVKVIVVDESEPFDLLGYEPIETQILVNEGIKGKLGINMIKSTCDELYYSSKDGINETVMIKYNKKSS